MAYSNLLSLENIIDQILDHDQFSIPPHEKKQIISLSKYVIFFQAFLEDFPEKAKHLEARIRVVAAEAEDIIEWFLWKQKYNKRIPVVRRMIFKHQLQKLADEMDSIAAKVVDVQNSNIIKEEHLGDPTVATSSAQVEDWGKNNVVGFNEDLIKIKEGLCGWAPQLQVLPIFGMGGIGKTTLARKAYHDQLIMEHFQIRVWITISQNYIERRILLDLLDSMKEFDTKSTAENIEQCNETEEKSESTGEISEEGKESPAKTHELSNSDMALKVHKILSGRKFLIVMDDIWNTKVLDDVKHLFPNSNNGSRIMLTTRLTEVANYANSSILSHQMHLMDGDQSWNLLCEKVFVNQDRVHPELISIGREIVKSCGGLPLAIVVIAGLLSTTSRTLASWEEVARNIRSSLSTTDGQIEKILSLSYRNLPHHLRPCFLYMGGFPEDHEIKVTYLIRLWIAESFVKPVESKEFEDTAEMYLEDLVDRSLIVVTKRKSNGKIKCCGLHDMVREMCIQLSQEEKFLMHVKGSRSLKLLKRMKHQRRISISHSDLNSFSNIFSPTIRTIIYFQDELIHFGSFKLLRVLDVLRVKFEYRSLPNKIFELFHLRYLAFHHSYQIPGVISNLQCLKTLIIKGSFSNLPHEIWNMPQLRHLVSDLRISDTNGVTSALQNLQTLRVKNLVCSISTLNLIPNLKELRVTYSSLSGELLFHNIFLLSQLEKLHLELKYAWTDSGKPNLVVPTSLKSLTLIGWDNVEPYLKIVGPFPNLEVFKLRRFTFSRRIWRTTDEEFPQLKFLLIEESDVRRWDTESSHFPRLKAVHIHSCLALRKIPDCIGEIPTLELIELKLCSISLAESAKRIQEEAESYGDDVFQVRCIDCKVNADGLPPKPTFRLEIFWLLSGLIELPFSCFVCSF